MMTLVTSFLVLLVLHYQMIHGENILGIVPVPQNSHNILFQRLMMGLARKGHNVTFLSNLKLKTPVPNLTEIHLPYSKEEAFESMEINCFHIRHISAWDQMMLSSYYGHVISEKQLKSEQLQNLLKSQSTYDVIIAEGFLSESVSAVLAHRFKAPLIAFMTYQPSLWSNYLVYNEAPSSYIPEPFLGYPPQMSFLQRLHSLVFNLLGTLNLYLFYLPGHDVIMRKFTTDQTVPPLIDIIQNTSLVFVNDHLSLNYARPLVPNVVPIGGVHLEEPKELPADIKEYLDSSKKGAILFSLGSNIKASMMTKPKLAIFIEVFSKLDQNVLWKYEKNLTKKPNNVLISKWLPQSDILAHPNLKLFITHGGILSTIEAIDRGVAVLGIPIFADQPMNMRHAVQAGFGLSIDFDQLSVENLLSAIKELLNNPKYTAAAKHRSQLLKDQQLSPLDSAIWWVEYVIRHKGAPHLRSPARHLNYFQRHQFDTISLLIILASIFVWICCKIVRRLLKRILFLLQQNRTNLKKTK